MTRFSRHIQAQFKPGCMMTNAVSDLYEAAALSIPCEDCGAEAGDHCAPYMRYASRTGRAPVADRVSAHKARTAPVWAIVSNAIRALRSLTCPRCGMGIELFPSSSAHRCSPSPSEGPSIEDQVAEALNPALDLVIHAEGASVTRDPEITDL